MEKLQKNISFIGVSKLFTTLLAFILVPVATRKLGSEQFGIYTLATTLGFILVLLSDMGIYTITAREISKKPGIASSFYSRVFSTKIFLTAFALPMLLGYLFIMKYDATSVYVILVFAVSAVLTSFSKSAFGVFQGFQRMQYEAICISTEKIISFAIGIAFLFLGFGVKTFIWSFVISGIALFALAHFYLYKLFIKFRLRFSTKQSLVILSVSTYVGASAFLAMIYNHLDILMLSKMANLTDIGHYSAAYQILRVTSIFPTILATAFLPQLTQLSKKPESLAELFAKGLGYLAIIIIPLVPAIMILHEPLFIFIVGPEMLPGADAFQILAVAVVFQMLNIFFVPLYVATDHQRKIVQFQVIGLVVNVVLNLLLIPLYSFMGASYATVATELCIFALIYVWIQGKLPKSFLPDLRYILKLLLSTLIMCIFILLSGVFMLHIAAVVLISILLYFVCLERFKAVNFTHLLRNIVSLRK